MKIRSLIWILLAASLSLGGGKKVESSLVTFHIEGNEHDNPKFVMPVSMGSDGRTYIFSKIPSFTDKDIQWFYPFTSQNGQSYGVAFQLKSHSAVELKGLCATNPGKLIGCRVTGAPLQAVIIDRPVNDGVIVVWEGLTQNHLQAFRKKFPHVDDFRGVSSSAIDTGPQFEMPSKSKTKKPLFQFKKKES